MTLLMLILLLTLSKSKCSRILEAQNQNGIHITDYCPKAHGCEEGTHVICLYYSPDREMGPACKEYEDVSITPDYAQYLLNIVNSVRSKVANGLVKGQDNKILPRGYGMFRIGWDEELATFAQIWANQCMLMQDLCRSSKKFPDVAQEIGITRFSVDGWKPISGHPFNSTMLTPDKVKYALTSIMQAWFDMKRVVTLDMIKNPQSTSNQFLELVRGSITHMGCGISAYKEFAYHNDNADLVYNSVQLVCNFSERPRKGQPVYSTEPPSEPGYTMRCGCPFGYDEDDDCLCYDGSRRSSKWCKNNRGRCNPPGVLLPIFTVEDAPQDLIREGKRNTSHSYLVDINNGNLDHFDLIQKSKDAPYNYNTMFGNLLAAHHESSRNFRSDVGNRYFGKKFTPRIQQKQKQYRIPGVQKNRRQASRQSLFSKVAIFELPVKNSNRVVIPKEINSYKKDVAPRKDFTSAKKLVTNYIDRKKSGNIPDIDLNLSDINKNLNSLNNLNHNNLQILANENVNKENSFNRIDYKSPNEDSERKLMELLDKLEKEIRNIELNTNEKEIFDEKIRKIYETIVGHTDFLDDKLGILNKHTFIDQMDNQSQSIKMDANKNDNVMGIEKLDKSKDFLKDYRKRDYMYRDLENRILNSNINYNKIRYEPTNSYKNIKEEIQSRGNLYRIEDNMNERGIRNNYDFKEKIDGGEFRGSDVRDENYYLRGDDEYYPMDLERRKYYQDKLESLRRRVDILRKTDHRNEGAQGRGVRPVRPTKLAIRREAPTHKRTKEMNSFYMPDRARFVHGF